MFKLVINNSDHWCQKGNGLRILVIFNSTFFIWLVLNSIDVLFTEGCECKKELGPSLSKSSQCETVAGGLLDCSTHGGCHCFSKDVEEYVRLIKDSKHWW